jgi:ATP-dependent DNA ligase
MDLFDKKNIKPMLIYEMKEAFDSEDFLYEIKWDGIRVITYIDENSVDIRNKKNKMMLPTLPELAELNKQVKCKCILDCELVVLKGSYPDFYEVQRRSVMTNQMKINIAMKQLPVSLITYDILYYKDHDVLYTPLIERKKLLEEAIIENERLIVSRFIETYGVELYKQVEEKKLEGIVAKRKTSSYWQGKRSKDWIKCKRMFTDDCIVCGYIFKEKNMTSLILGQYDGDKLKYKGHVTLGVTLKKLYQQGFKQIECSPFGYQIKGNEKAIWIEPENVCIIEYMPTDKSSYRQAVFKGFRDDKLASECQLTNLK